MEAAPQSQLTVWQVLRRRGWRTRFLLSLALALGAGLALRVYLFVQFFEVEGDSLVYGGIAKNLILAGHYSVLHANGVVGPSIIRLPGYPLFLALCFRLFGMENYASAVYLQIALDLIASLLLADFARRIAPVQYAIGAAQCTLWLTMLCPFTAIYVATPLSEGLTLFFLALALWSAVCFSDNPSWGSGLWLTFALTYTALLRPDGFLAAVALAPPLVFGLIRTGLLRKQLRMMVTCVLLAAAPFALWTLRNWRVFHVFQPLAPRYATEVGEDIHPGWKRWFKSWSLDFDSTYAVSWEVPGSELDMSQIPARVFDSPGQYAEVAALAAEYNRGGMKMTPYLDGRFGQIADERIAAHPLRYYVWLPLGRVADMWLRPRVENLPIDLDWWVYVNHPDETRLSWAYLVLNLIFLVLAAAGILQRPRLWAAMLAYFLLRSALLLTVGAPEARYTIECFPMIFALSGLALYRFTYTVLLSVLRANALSGSD